MRRFSREEGNAAVETVLLAPVLLAVLAVMIAGGRTLATRSAVESLARETARSASQAVDPDHALFIVHDRARDLASEMGLDPERLEVVADLGGFTRGEPMSVTATYRVLLADLPAFGLFPGSFEVSARQVEFVERFKSR